MKKINLRGLQEKLSAKELKNVLGGSEGEIQYGSDCCMLTCIGGYEINMCNPCSYAYILCYGGVESTITVQCPFDPITLKNCHDKFFIQFLVRIN